MSEAVQTFPSCDPGLPGSVCGSTTIASDAGVGVLSGLNAGPVISACVAAAVLLAAVIFAAWVVRRVSVFFDVGLLGSFLVDLDDERRERVERFKAASLSAGRGRSLVDDDDREDDDEDDDEDDGMGANKRGVQGGLT